MGSTFFILFAKSVAASMVMLDFNVFIKSSSFIFAFFPFNDASSLSVIVAVLSFDFIVA